MKLTEWQDRVVGEKSELDKKIINLSKFIFSENFKYNVHPDDCQRMRDQLKAMVKYSELLEDRIFYFKEEI